LHTKTSDREDKQILHISQTLALARSLFTGKKCMSKLNLNLGKKSMSLSKRQVN